MQFDVGGRRRADGQLRTRVLSPSSYGANAEAIARMAREIRPPSVEHQVVSLRALGLYLAEMPALKLDDVTDQLINEAWVSSGKQLSQSKLIGLRDAAISGGHKDIGELLGPPPLTLGGVLIDAGVIGAGGETALALARHVPSGLPPTALRLAAQAIKRFCIRVRPRSLCGIDSGDIEQTWNVNKPAQLRARNYLLRTLAEVRRQRIQLDPSVVEMLLRVGYLPEEAVELGLVRFFELEHGKRSEVKVAEFAEAAPIVGDLCDLFDQVQRKLTASARADTLGAIRSFGLMLQTSDAPVPLCISDLQSHTLLNFESSCDRGARGYHLWRNLRLLLLEAPKCGRNLNRGVENLLQSMVTTLPLPERGYREALPDALVRMMVVKARLELIQGLQHVLVDASSAVTNRNNSRSSEQYIRGIMAARILLHVATDLEPEFTGSIALENIRPEASSLKVSDLPSCPAERPWMSTNPQFFQLAFAKARARGKYRSILLEPRSLGMWTIDIVLRMTAPFRSQSERLFIMPDGEPPNWHSHERSRTSLRRWCDAYRSEWRKRAQELGLQVDIDKELDNLQWGRFRKSALARDLMHSDVNRLIARLGLAIQGEHTVSTFTRSYLPGMPGVLAKWDDEFREFATHVEGIGGRHGERSGLNLAETAVGGCADLSLLSEGGSESDCLGDLFGLCVLCENAVFSNDDVPQLVFLEQQVFRRQAEEAAAMELGELPSLLLGAVVELLGRFDAEVVAVADSRVRAGSFMPPPLAPGLLQAEAVERLR